MLFAYYRLKSLLNYGCQHNSDTKSSHGTHDTWRNRNFRSTNIMLGDLIITDTQFTACKYTLKHYMYSSGSLLIVNSIGVWVVILVAKTWVKQNCLFRVARLPAVLDVEVSFYWKTLLPNKHIYSTRSDFAVFTLFMETPVKQKYLLHWGYSVSFCYSDGETD